MSEPTTTAALFAPGWLDEQLRAVVDELLARPPEDRPRLTGERARRLEAIGGSECLRK